ncbi:MULTISPECIES: CHAT domain-containing protein [unclassified Moorena]|uniref:CHAT domain-containing protein n=1 Tax=unclassified Moorena TaxID=2683338 RepID=UPI001400073C|nr:MULTISPECIES: CHAT domain-containing protein [unclassified Moorena]NEO13735.1 tetratricopeptide repeat protein [Moorena sp. SIO3E8]NEP98400.1 tetratricopeptide repeat protein [Moorena sp. SIO3F7]
MKASRIATIALLGILASFSPPSLGNVSSLLPTSPALAQTSERGKAEAYRLFEQGSQQYKVSQFRKALESWRKALTIYQTIEDQQGEANSLIGLGNAYHALGKYPKAIDNHQQSLKMARAIRDQQGEANSLIGLGYAYHAQGEYPKAIKNFQQSLKMARAIRDRQGEANSLSGLGNAYNSQGKYRKAIDKHQDSLAIYREIKDPQGKVASLVNLGNAYHAQGDYPKAIDKHEQSLKMAQAIKDLRGQANSLIGLGHSYNAQGEYQKAIENFEQSLNIARAIGDPTGEASSRIGLGNAYHSLGDSPKAIENHEQSLTITEAIGDRQGKVASLVNLGYSYQNQGNYQKAIENFEQSLKMARAIEDLRGEGNSLSGLGHAYHAQGNYREAIKHYHQSLDIYQQIGDRIGEAASLNNLGHAYNSLGDYSEAITKFKQSLNIPPDINDRTGEANSLSGLGHAYHAQGNYREAIKHYQQSLDIARAIRDPRGQANSLSGLGHAYQAQGDYPKAIKNFEQSLKMAQAIGDQQGEANSVIGLGIAYRSQGDYQKAIGNYQQSLKIARQIKDQNQEVNSLYNLGYSLFQLGNLEQAETTLTKGIEVIEYLATGLQDIQTIPLSEKHSNTYSLLQEVLIARNKTDAALEVAERGRARALAELLRKGLLPELDTPATDLSIKKIKHIARQQKATLVEYSIIPDEGIYVWVIQPTGKIEWRSVKLPPDTSVQQLIDKGYACLGNHGQCRSSDSSGQPSKGDWVKLQDDQFEERWQVVEVNGQQGTLRLNLPGWEEGVTVERPITDVDKIVDSPNIDKPHLQKLHQLLIEPIADLLPKDENARVVFIPHRELFSVPFPALQDQEKKYLIEKHTILTAPSIEVLGLTHQQRKNLPKSSQIALVVGNPTMPEVRPAPGKTPQQLSPLDGAEQEAKNVASQLQLFSDESTSRPLATSPLNPPILGDFNSSSPQSWGARGAKIAVNAQLLLGQDATETKVKRQMPKARYIHFATHGLFAPKRIGGIGSAIALAPSVGEDGLLTAEEIFDMKLSAELVVVSACETGVGEINSEGVIGLSRSLVAAGVPSVMVSLWSIPDDKTTELMTEFYRNLERTGDKAQALRQAMLTMIPKSGNPKDWAAFTLIGEAL